MKPKKNKIPHLQSPSPKALMALLLPIALGLGALYLKSNPVNNENRDPKNPPPHFHSQVSKSTPLGENLRTPQSQRPNPISNQDLLVGRFLKNYIATLNFSDSIFQSVWSKLREQTHLGSPNVHSVFKEIQIYLSRHSPPEQNYLHQVGGCKNSSPLTTGSVYPSTLASSSPPSPSWLTLLQLNSRTKLPKEMSLESLNCTFNERNELSRWSIDPRSSDRILRAIFFPKALPDSALGGALHMIGEPITCEFTFQESVWEEKRPKLIGLECLELGQDLSRSEHVKFTKFQYRRDPRDPSYWRLFIEGDRFQGLYTRFCPKKAGFWIQIRASSNEQEPILVRDKKCLSPELPPPIQGEFDTSTGSPPEKSETFPPLPSSSPPSRPPPTLPSAVAPLRSPPPHSTQPDWDQPELHSEPGPSEVSDPLPTEPQTEPQSEFPAVSPLRLPVAPPGSEVLDTSPASDDPPSLPR